jgi:hypothetical protein
MLRTAIILSITMAAASLANAADVTNTTDTTTVHHDNGAETTTVHHTTVRTHHHYRRHHRFHPVHDASEIIHHATGTQPVYPKPVTN